MSMGAKKANATSFKPGYRSRSWVPIGTERFSTHWLPAAEGD
jgi:hypothetical protein